MPIPLGATDNRAGCLRFKQRQIFNCQAGAAGILLNLIELRASLHVLGHHVQTGSLCRVKSADNLQRIAGPGIGLAQRNALGGNHISASRAPDPHILGGTPELQATQLRKHETRRRRIEIPDRHLRRHPNLTLIDHVQTDTHFDSGLFRARQVDSQAFARLDFLELRLGDDEVARRIFSVLSAHAKQRGRSRRIGDGIAILVDQPDHTQALAPFQIHAQRLGSDLDGCAALGDLGPAFSGRRAKREGRRAAQSRTLRRWPGLGPQRRRQQSERTAGHIVEQRHTTELLRRVERERVHMQATRNRMLPRGDRQRKLFLARTIPIVDPRHKTMHMPNLTSTAAIRWLVYQRELGSQQQVQFAGLSSYFKVNLVRLPNASA